MNQSVLKSVHTFDDIAVLLSSQVSNFIGGNSGGSYVDMGWCKNARGIRLEI
jgi:hypothetical protein